MDSDIMADKKTCLKYLREKEKRAYFAPLLSFEHVCIFNDMWSFLCIKYGF